MHQNAETSRHCHYIDLITSLVEWKYPVPWYNPECKILKDILKWLLVGFPLAHRCVPSEICWKFYYLYLYAVTWTGIKGTQSKSVFFRNSILRRQFGVVPSHRLPLHPYFSPFHNFKTNKIFENNKKFLNLFAEQLRIYWIMSSKRWI